MAKYRIVQKININTSGTTITRFHIERGIRVFFFTIWLPAPIKSHYFTHKHKAGIINRYYSFDDLQRAKEVVSMLKSKVNMSYRGQRIKQVFTDDYRLIPVYINTSNKVWWVKGYFFEFSESLDNLKSAIDNRLVKTISNVVYVG